MIKKTLAASIITLTFFFFPAFSQTSVEVIHSKDLKKIESLKPSTKKYSGEAIPDSYSEYSKIIEKNYMLLASGKSPVQIFYKYTNTEFKNLLQLAARCNITYETIATLNGIENSSTDITNMELLLPTCPGLFINNSTEKNKLDILLFQNYNLETLTKKIIWYSIDDKEFIFILNQRLSPTERAFFLDAELQLPINKDSYWISSDFGKRKNPFSGELKNHKGIDLAAKEGTPVFAIKDGNVALKVKNDTVFGNYLILTHDLGKMTSVYAHLSDFAVEKEDIVKKGDLIGFVGHTGMATGPHLHFEVRQDGVAQNPGNILKLK